MKRIIAYISLIYYVTFPAWGQVTSEWRGPGRTGIYPETGLLKVWPDGGPRLILSVTGLPAGNSSVAIGNDRLFVAGTRDSLEWIVALDRKGNRLWETIYGRAWTESFPESRSTPTVENGRVYVVSGKLDAACIDAE